MKKSFIKYLVPLIMIFFFVRNIVLVETKNLDSWMGGGMRMFGKIDKMLYRVSGFNVNYNGKIYFVNLRAVKALEDEDVGSRILPSDERLNDALNEIKKQSWCYNKVLDAIVLKGNDNCDGIINSGNIIEFKVYQTHYDHQSKLVILKPLNDAKNE